MIAATSTLVPGIVPVENALAAVRRRRGPESTRGLVPGLRVSDGTRGWLPAAHLLSDGHERAVAGGRDPGIRELDDLLDAAKQRWVASPHVAAALAWRSYTYWLAMPVVIGWATARRVLLVEPDDVLIRTAVRHDEPPLMVGLRRVRLAVLPGDPLAGAGVATGAAAGVDSGAAAGVDGGAAAGVDGGAAAGVDSGAAAGVDSGAAAGVAAGVVAATATATAAAAAGSAVPVAFSGADEVTVVASEADLLQVFRASLRDRHLDPLLERIRSRVNLGTRTMLGSLASAVAYGVVRGIEAPEAELAATAETLLTALDVSDLVDLVPGADGLDVRRRTCCLAFTLPEPKVCSGCCLRPAPQ